ncbi:MAG: hypothetical protein ONB17_03180 [candidate division KSB1 bacterium]|nr:hypothetical protein [candidate division KSB1 bacterium]MDZ7386613.1 hypothetical protein [candidate division KSB1 bacterium]MDZ7391907.1 hypothetical protein [candidate division KSB1 bacterium]MDZ7413623.1 hypothetical protein [candidate division KSB1 bacterium]
MSATSKTGTVLLCTLCLLMSVRPSTAASGGPAGSRATQLPKPTGHEDRKSGIHDGNKIMTIFYNYGSIGNWYGGYRYLSGVYPKGSGHSYIAEFTPIIGAEVVDAEGHIRHIFSDGYADASRNDRSPLGYQWGFEPLPGYADPNQSSVAMSDALDNDGDGKPDSWPWVWPDRPEWVNPVTRVPLWNGQYGAYARADQESYFVMNDYVNDEFKFYPDPFDSTKRGLAIEVQVRGYQWAHPAAEDILIWTYWVKNTGLTEYQKMVFGMYGDADVGDDGDQRDDDSWFDQQDDIVYQYDHDNVGAWGGPVAYFGFKYLESPGDPFDGKDNDGDGMVDESQDDGIDNDGDWNPETDDIGSDGVGPLMPEYIGPDADGTEGNGQPDPGEPNFEYTDNDEADQIGLTSFDSKDWRKGLNLANDEEMWQLTTPGHFIDNPEQTTDITFLYGSGYFPLKPGRMRKFAIAMLFGEDQDDIFRNARIMQIIYDRDYNFTKPPLKPKVTAVPGDHKVTLYWDRAAEKSWDPIYGFDFEGYRIYRSTDPGFLESYTITDAYGNPTFNKPVAIIDLKDGLKGPHPVAFNGVQMDMGNDSGLLHFWTDTNVENGQTYYYAVCSYDKGYYSDFYERGISPIPYLPNMAPAECSKRIRTDAAGRVLSTDLNTVVVRPNAPAAGYREAPQLSTLSGSLEHVSGFATGTIQIVPVDPMRVPDGRQYAVSFKDDYPKGSDTTKTFSIMDLTRRTGRFVADTAWVPLEAAPLVADSVLITPVGGGRLFVPGVDFRLDARNGQVAILPGGAMSIGQQYEYSYLYYPVFRSPYVQGQLDNPIFDGLRVVVQDQPLAIDQQNSGWIKGDCNYTHTVRLYTGGKLYESDFEFRFEGRIGERVRDGQVFAGTHAPFVIWNVCEQRECRFVLMDKDGNKYWNPGESIVLLPAPTGTAVTYEVILQKPDSLLVDSTLVRVDTRYIHTTIGGIDTVIALIDSVWAYDTTFVQINHPEPGDVWLLHTTKPFRAADRYTFTAEGSKIVLPKAKAKIDSMLSRIAVVPNPYVVTASWEPQHFYQSGRGERKIDFIHLPAKCTIKIFTTRGYLVKEIHHDSPIDNGAESWNLLSKDGMEIAYGIYIYHIEAPGLGSTVGKFAVIK